MRKPLHPTHKAFMQQPGLEGNPWRGMNREGNRLLPDDDQFYTLQNMRLVGGQWQNRGGQTKANASAASGTAVTGLYSSDGLELDEAAKVLYQREPTPVVPTTFSYYLAQSSYGQLYGLLPATPIVDLTGGTGVPVTALGNDGVRTLGSTPLLYVSGIKAGIPSVWSCPAVPIATAEMDATLVGQSTGGAAFIADSVLHGSDLLFFQIHRGSAANTGAMWAWNGSSFVHEGDTLMRPGYVSMNAWGQQALFTLGSDAYVHAHGEVATPGTVKFFKRDPGGGSWSLVLSMAEADFVAAGGAINRDKAILNGGAEFQSKAWFRRSPNAVIGESSAEELWSFNGTNLVLENTMASPVGGAPYGNNDFAAPLVFDSYLYYVWSRVADGETILGRTADGALFTDTYHVLTDITTIRYASSLNVVDGNMYIPAGDKIISSDGADTTVWTTVNSGTPGTGWIGSFI
jgi:hypothetical protein